MKRTRAGQRRAFAVPPAALPNNDASVGEPPVVDAYDDGRTYRVSCVYCKTFHHHGRMPGHRVSHCSVPSSPYELHGYVLRYAGVWVPPTKTRAAAR